MKATLQLRHSQHLALTPQLQQSIRLLQLSTLELDQEIEQILAQNPMLERLDGPLDQHERLGAQGELPSTASDADPESARHDAVADRVNDGASDHDADASSMADGDFGGREFDGGALDAHDFDGTSDLDPDRGSGVDTRIDTGAGAGTDGGDAGDDGGPSSDDDADRSLDLDPMQWDGEAGLRGDDGDDRGSEQIPDDGRSSLTDHLLEQLAGLRGGPRDRALVHCLIQELDDDGYLRTTLDDVAAGLPPSLGIDGDELRTALMLLQSFDPAGVGARDLAECLRLQLPTAARRIGAGAAIEALARRVVDGHLELLAARDYARLRRLLDCDDEALRQTQALIVSLDPKPGSRFDAVEAGYVVPDVIVRRTREGWRATLNTDVMPRLRVNDHYARLLASQRTRGAAGGSANGAVTKGRQVATGVGANGTNPSQPDATSSSASQQLATHLQEARWLVKNVHQRFATILRVSQEIVDRQRAFFSHGAIAMRPLVLREIADAVGLHESTISRVTTNKYMLTPFGTVELKYFFGSHVATDSGGAASSTAIRALIKQLVEKEEPHDPLSDSRIAELLGEQGIVVARRTVAKYREVLRIPPVAQRKAL